MAYDVARAVDAMHALASVWSVGYSQGTGRWSIRDGGECDCSSAVAWAVNSGFDEVVLDHATYTGNLRVRLAALGFQVLPGSTAPQVGDVVLNEGGHVAMCTRPGALAEAWINEYGDITGGQPGDQTGGETREVAYATHPMTIRGAWTHVLRPPATTVEAATMAAPTTPLQIGVSMFLVHARTPWGADTYTLVTEGHGAYAQGDVMAQVYNRCLGRFTEASWDEYNALIREAWQRVGLIGDDLAQRVQATLPKQEA